MWWDLQYNIKIHILYLHVTLLTSVIINPKVGPTCKYYIKHEDITVQFPVLLLWVLNCGILLNKKYPTAIVIKTNLIMNNYSLINSRQYRFADLKSVLIISCWKSWDVRIVPESYLYILTSCEDLIFTLQYLELCSNSFNCIS